MGPLLPVLLKFSRSPSVHFKFASSSLVRFQYSSSSLPVLQFTFSPPVHLQYFSSSSLHTVLRPFFGTYRSKALNLLLSAASTHSESDEPSSTQFFCNRSVRFLEACRRTCPQRACGHSKFRCGHLKFRSPFDCFLSHLCHSTKCVHLLVPPIILLTT